MSELRDVPGPSALGGGRRRAWELLTLIAFTEFKRTYFGTALGYVWSICRPLLLFAVLLAVFTQAFRAGAGVEHYPVLLLANVVLFSFFQEATGAAVQSALAAEAIVRKTQFPRLVIPLATVLTALMNLGPNLVVLLVFVFAFGVAPMWTWLLVPLLVLALLVFTVAVSVILSSLYPRFRDVGIIWTVASTALFYGTPIFYPLESVSPTLRSIVSLNPMAPIFSQLHRWLIDGSAPGAVALSGGWVRMLIPVAIYVAVCGLAVWVFRREAPRLAESM